MLGPRLFGNHIGFFWMKFMWKVYTLIRFVITLEMSRYDFQRASQEAPKEGPKTSVQAVPGGPWRWSSQRPVMAVTPRQRVPSWENYPRFKGGTFVSNCSQRRRSVTIHRGCDSLSRRIPYATFSCASVLPIKRVNGKFTSHFKLIMKGLFN